MEFLIQSGAEVDTETQHGYTPLHFAAQNGYSTATQLLTEYHAKVNRKTHQGHLEVIQILVEGGANLDLSTQEGETCLHVVSELGVKYR